jgi:hypothetical protein
MQVAKICFWISWIGSGLLMFVAAIMQDYVNLAKCVAIMLMSSFMLSYIKKNFG